MRLKKAMLTFLAIFPIFLISSAAEAELRQAIISVKGMVCDS